MGAMKTLDKRTSILLLRYNEAGTHSDVLTLFEPAIRR